MTFSIERTRYVDYLGTPVPNRQPIYPKIPFSWRAGLTTQVGGYDLNDPGVAAPVLLGQASEAGAIIEMFHMASINPFNTGSGGGGYGGSNPNGPFGWSVDSDPTLLRFYTQRFGENKLWFWGEFALPENARFLTVRAGAPILPAPQTAWRLAPQESIYVALSKAIDTPGMNVFLLGGHYQ